MLFVVMIMLTSMVDIVTMLSPDEAVVDVVVGTAVQMSMERRTLYSAVNLWIKVTSVSDIKLYISTEDNGDDEDGQDRQ